MFKMQDLKRELINDPEMYRMIQPNIRGGICYASCRYARSNNIYMGAMYRPDEPESFIMYIDATNLYGWAMSQKLPFSDFEWLSDAQLREAEAALTNDDWLQTVQFLDSKARFTLEFERIVNADGPLNPPAQTNLKPNTAYIVEVDLEYPANIHDRDDVIRSRRSCWRSRRRCSRRSSCVIADSTTATAYRSVQSSCTRCSQKGTTLCSARRSSFTWSAA